LTKLEPQGNKCQEPILSCCSALDKVLTILMSELQGLRKGRSILISNLRLTKLIHDEHITSV